MKVLDRVGINQRWQVKVFLIAWVIITISHVFVVLVLIERL